MQKFLIVVMFLGASMCMHGQNYKPYAFNVGALSSDGPPIINMWMATSVSVTKIGTQAKLRVSFNIKDVTVQPMEYYFGGKLYTVEQLGRQAFLDLQPWNFKFRVDVNGPGGKIWDFNHYPASQSLFISDIPADAKAEDFHVVVSLIDYLEYRGKKKLEQKIINYAKQTVPGSRANSITAGAASTPKTKVSDGASAPPKGSSPSGMEILEADRQKRAQEQTTAKVRAAEREEQLSGYAGAVKNVSGSNARVNETMSFSEKYNNVQDLDKAYKEKSAALNTELSNNLESRNELTRAGANYFYGNNAGMNALSQGVGIALNSIGEGRRQQRAQEQLKRERDEMAAEIEKSNAKEKARSRAEILGILGEGELPTSETQIPQSQIWYFAVAYDEKLIANNFGSVYISNVFPHSKYSDGTWPFRADVISQIKERTPLRERFIGYFASETEAKELRSKILRLLSQDGGSVKQFEFAGLGLKTPAAVNNEDSRPALKPSKVPAAAPQKKAAQAKKAKDSFWDD